MSDPASSTGLTEAVEAALRRLVVPQPLALTSQQAAALLGVSHSHFKRHVARALPQVRIGNLVRYPREDLKRWLDAQKAGPSSETPEGARGSSGSGTRVTAIDDPRAARIAQRLKGKRRASTKR